MSSEIKSTIGILCKLINLLYGSHLKAEHLRLAKFNKTDENVVPILWDTLALILNTTNATLIQEKLLHSFNYIRFEFHNMINAGQSFQSRELLLALAYLLSTKVDQDLKKKIDLNLPDLQAQTNDPNELNNHEKLNWKKLDGNELKNYKKWLYGKICSNNNMMLEYEEQIEKICKKYNKILDLKAHIKLTVYEILALKNKQFGEQFLHNTEEIVRVMSVYTEWLKKEKVFWKWMNSVLEESRKNS